MVEVVVELGGLFATVLDSHYRACVVGISVRYVDGYVACCLLFDCRRYDLVRSFTTSVKARYVVTHLRTAITIEARRVQSMSEVL